MMIRKNHSSIAIIPTIEIIQNCNIFYNRRAGCPVKEALIVAGKCVVNTNSIDCWGYTPAQVAWIHMPCLRSVGISSCLPLCCPSIYFSVDICSFSHKLLVLSISPIPAFSPQAVAKPLLVPSFLMWSNLVFHRAHLNILIKTRTIWI